MRSLITILLLLGWGSASAIPVTWNFQDVVFDDGGTLTGSFVFDADVSPYSYSDINVVTSNGSSLDGAAYADCFFICFSATEVIFETPDRAQRLYIKLDQALTNSGGTILLTQGCLPIPCGSAEDTIPVTNERLIVSGVVTAVPIPAAVWLFASGLGLLGWFKREVK